MGIFKKLKVLGFFFKATWQEYPLGESSPSELLILPHQYSNRFPSILTMNALVSLPTEKPSREKTEQGKDALLQVEI